MFCNGELGREKESKQNSREKIREWKELRIVSMADIHLSLRQEKNN